MTVSLNQFLEKGDYLSGADRARLAALCRPLLRKGVARRYMRPKELASHFLNAYATVHRHECSLVEQHADRFVECRIVVPRSDLPRRPSGGILLASTPRSGNSILRRLLGREGFVEALAHSLDDIYWNALPDEYILQCHVDFNGSRTFVDWAAPRVITAVRHPIDALLSAWQFAQHDESIRHWLGGAVGLPAGPDDSFLSWALSDGAARMLDVSVSWIANGAIVVRYEDMQRDAESTFQDVMAAVGRPATAGDVLQAMEAEGARMGKHVWRKTPGAWKSLMRADLAALERRHREVFEVTGYERRES